MRTTETGMKKVGAIPIVETLIIFAFAQNAFREERLIRLPNLQPQIFQ